jgi:putative holliday junction resolvase
VARGDGDLDRIEQIAREHAAVLVYVGLPRSLSGSEGPAAVKVRGFAGELAARLAPVPVRLVDERLSTVTAEAALRQTTGRGRASGKRRRAVVDQAAAVVILQNALDTERGRGALPGEVVATATQPDEGATP